MSIRRLLTALLCTTCLVAACGEDPDETQTNSTSAENAGDVTSIRGNATSSHTSDGCTTSTTLPNTTPQTGSAPAPFIADDCDPERPQDCCPDGLFPQTIQHTQRGDDCHTIHILCVPNQTCGSAETDFLGPDGDCIHTPNTCPPLPAYADASFNNPACAEPLCIDNSQ